MPTHDPPGCSRRHLLLASGAVAVGSLAGCLGGPETTPAPVALSGGLECDVCGMVIENHPGPSGQLFFEDEGPEGHDPPARFDSLKQCFFPYKLEHEAMGWTVTAVYVTDYSSVDYTIQTEGDTTYVSSHPEAEAFAPAAELDYLVGSEVTGAMGPDFIPFSTRADAETLQAEYGGEIVAYDEIDEGLVGR